MVDSKILLVYFGMNFNQSTSHLRGFLSSMQAEKMHKERYKIEIKTLKIIWHFSEISLPCQNNLLAFIEVFLILLGELKGDVFRKIYSKTTE